MRFFDRGLRRLVIIGINDYAVEACRLATAEGVDVRVVSAPRFRDLPAIHPLPGMPDTCDGRIRALGIELVELERLSVDDLALWKVDDWAAFSFDSPFIIKGDVIRLFEDRIFNEHGACLPQGRGGGGFTWRILEGDRRGRVVFHRLVEEVDAGAIVYARDFTFDASCRKPADYALTQAKETLADLPGFISRLVANDDFAVVEQDPISATYFPRLSTPDQAWIDWTWSTRDIERFVLAFSDPYPGARTMVNGICCIVRDAVAVPSELDLHPFKTGIVFNIVDGELMVCGRDGSLRIREHSLEGTSHRLTVGDRLYTPPDRLAWGLSRRPVYGPIGLRWKEWKE